jgi:hypothetical protein
MLCRKLTPSAMCFNYEIRMLLPLTKREGVYHIPVVSFGVSLDVVDQVPI